LEEKEGRVVGSFVEKEAQNRSQEKEFFHFPHPFFIFIFLLLLLSPSLCFIFASQNKENKYPSTHPSAQQRSNICIFSNFTLSPDTGFS
jgi:uncharacterized membrane protein YadS